MLIKTKYIDCASKSVFNTWKLPTSAADTSGDIYWSAIVYIQDTGEVWTHGKLYGGFFSNADSNKVSLTIGGTTKILALDGHVQSYTTLTGSGTTADQAILSTGVANKWTLKTLGKNAFSNVDYLPADATAVAAEKVVNAMRFQYNGKDMHSFDGSVARLLNIIQGDNVFITGDSQGNVTIAADPGSNTVNTAGATNLIDKKLFLIGAESQTTSPQTYSNQYVYIGTDNCLYSLGKKVLTEHQAIYNLDLQTQVGDAVTKVTTFDPNAANNSFTLVQGTNVTLIPNATNKKVTISSKDTTYDFYNLIFKQGDTVVDTYKPTTSPNKSFKAGTNVTFTKSGDEITVTTQDTRNTAGATKKLATKLFLTGSLTQTDNPQTYTNSKVYIGADNKLYSDGKVVSTGDHTHNYAGATTPGGPALKVDLNPSGLLDATYGSYGGILQDSNNGPATGSWSNRIKILHNNSSGYYTELAQAMTGTAGLWHRRNVAGVVSDWTPVIDKANFRTYLDATYVIRGNDPNVLTNYVRYSIASGLTMNWKAGNATPTHIWGAKNSDSSKAYVFNGDNIRAFANAVNRAGDIMTGTLVVSTKGTGEYNQGIRINRTDASQWATLTIGNVGTGTSGTSENTWLIGTPSNSNSLVFNRNSASENSGLCLKGHGNTDLKWNNNTVWHAGNDGSSSGLDADLLDGTHLSDIVYYAGANTYDNTSCSRIIPISNVDLTEGAKCGSIFQWTNTTTLPPSQSSTSNWFNQLYGSTNDRLYFRTRTNGSNWTSWHKLAYITDNVASATHASYPTGFTSKLSSATWGNQDGTFITGWSGPSSADIQFRNNDGKLNVIIDGVFYQDKGRYKVLDTNNYTSLLDARYLLKGSSVNTGNNSSWLSFSNDAGGIGGTMGTNDQWRIYGRSTASNAGYLEIATADDAAEPIYVRQYSGVFATLSRTLTLLDASGNTTMPGTVTAPTFTGALNGTAEYAKRLAVNNQLTYGLNGLTYFNANLSAGTAANSNVGPTAQWWHILRMNHANSAGYFADIAVPLNTSDGIYWRRITSGTNNGWYRLVDTNNYTGILDGRYVNTTGDTMTGKLTISTSGGGNQLTLNNTAGGESYFYLQSAGSNKGAFTTMQPSYGTCIFDATSSKYLGIKTNGTPHFQGNTLWHAGNDGSGSGLDADFLDGYHATALGVIYTFSAHNVYFCLGTATMPQNGSSINFKVATGNGYSASVSQCRNFNIYIRTSNGNASSGKYYAGHVEYGYYGSGGCNVYVVQNSSTSFTIWIGNTNYTGRSHFTASYSSNVSFSYSGQTSSGLPSGATQLTQVQYMYSDKTFSTLTLKANGTTIATYNGSSNVTYNINYSSVGAAPTSHTHDDRYYTETESDGRYFRDRGILNSVNPNVLVNGAYYSTSTSPVSGAHSYGILLNFRANPDNFQMYHPDNSADLWFRSNWNSQSTAGGTWTKVWTNRNLDISTYAPLSRLKKARIPGEVVDLFVYKVGSYTCTSTDYTTFKNQLFDSNGRGKSSVTYQPSYASSTTYTVDLSDFILAYSAISAYSNGMYTAGAGELESNRVGQSVGANSKTISGLEMPKHAHWFGHYRSDNANDRDVFGPDGGQNHSTNGTTSAGQGGNWRTGYSGSGSAKDWRPKTILVFKMVYVPQSW